MSGFPSSFSADPRGTVAVTLTEPVEHVVTWSVTDAVIAGEIPVETETLDVAAVAVAARTAQDAKAITAPAPSLDRVLESAKRISRGYPSEDSISKHQ